MLVEEQGEFKYKILNSLTKPSGNRCFSGNFNYLPCFLEFPVISQSSRVSLEQ